MCHIVLTDLTKGSIHPRIVDLPLTKRHPRRNFIRRAIEVEIRLAYHDRIEKTLPEAYHAAEAEALPTQAPGPEFDYEDPRKQQLREDA